MQSATAPSTRSREQHRSGMVRANQMATDARFTLAQLKHWDTRLAQELEILQHDIESSEATHHTCEAPNAAARACAIVGLTLSASHQVRRPVLRGDPRAARLARREGVALGRGARCDRRHHR